MFVYYNIINTCTWTVLIKKKLFFFLYLDIRFHEKAIYDMVQTGGDVDTTAVMTQHLFSQLIPGQEYVIDSRMEFLPDVCSCDEKSCKQKIKAGCTSLGLYENLKLHVR